MKGTRLPEDWTLPEDWKAWAECYAGNEGATINVLTVADEFRDYWIAKTGQNATKLNWQSTWRNWIRKTVRDYSRRKDKYGSSSANRAQAHVAVKTERVSKQDWQASKQIAQSHLEKLKRMTARRYGS